MFESRSGVFLIAGLGIFGLAFLANAVVPWLMYRNDQEKSVEEMVNANVLVQFQDLFQRYPEAFTRYFGAPPPLPPAHEAVEDRQAKRVAREEFFREKCATALRQGRDVYIGEACWHCHSQFCGRCPTSRGAGDQWQRAGSITTSCSGR
jgi:hypothetical protein